MHQFLAIIVFIMVNFILVSCRTTNRKETELHVEKTLISMLCYIRDVCLGSSLCSLAKVMMMVGVGTTGWDGMGWVDLSVVVFVWPGGGSGGVTR